MNITEIMRDKRHAGGAFFETGGRPVKRWSDETVAMVRRMAADGASVADMARATGEERTTLRGKAKRYGIHIPPRATPGSRLDAADAVLRREYPTNPDIHAVHALYCEAIGGHRALSSMSQRAQMLRLFRLCVSRADVAGNAGRAFSAAAEARRLARVPAIQERLDAGMPLKQIAAEIKMGREALQRIIADGLVVKRPRLAPVAKPRRLPRPAAPVVFIDPPEQEMPPLVLPDLPPPDETGRVRCSFWEVKAWAEFFGIYYDGSNMDDVNRRRAALLLPELTQCEQRTAAKIGRAA